MLRHYFALRILAPHFSSGHRVIAVNLPGIDYTKETRYYRQSPAEKAEVIRTLLAELDVSEFDICISHSSGVLPSVRLWGDQQKTNHRPLTIRSFAWFNPIGHQQIKAMKPEWFSNGLIQAWQQPTLRSLLNIVAPPILRLMGQPFMDKQNRAIDTTMWGGLTMRYAELDKYVTYLRELRTNPIPTLITISDRDKLISMRNFSAMLELMGSCVEDAVNYDDSGQLLNESVDSVIQSKAIEQRWLKVIRFTNGNHFAFIKYSDVINEVISEFLVEQLKLKLNCDKNVIKSEAISKDRNN